MPKSFYYSLKSFAGTAEFTTLVDERGSAREAILASVWYAEARHQPNFNACQCEIWMKRMAKSWRTQQIKRVRLKMSAAKVRCPEPKSKPQAKKKNLPEAKPRFLQPLLKNHEFYAVCSRSLSPFFAYQKLLMRYDAAIGDKRGELAQLIQARKVRVITRVFIGKVTNGRYNRQANRFEWPTEFKGVILKVRFEADGFKSAWKAELATADNCNIVRGWKSHFLHRMDRLYRLDRLVAARLKENGKSHLIRDLGLSRLAA